MEGFCMSLYIREAPCSTSVSTPSTVRLLPLPPPHVCRTHLEGEGNRGDEQGTTEASPAASTLDHQLVQDEHLAMECMHATSSTTTSSSRIPPCTQGTERGTSRGKERAPPGEKPRRRCPARALPDGNLWRRRGGKEKGGGVPGSAGAVAPCRLG
jgi:hypothetical protein